MYIITDRFTLLEHLFTIKNIRRLDHSLFMCYVLHSSFASVILYCNICIVNSLIRVLFVWIFQIREIYNVYCSYVTVGYEIIIVS